MPTIDELEPATAASDTDEFAVSQGGVARKVTRAQVLAGVQPQIAASSGTLLGRTSAGTGSPEQITVGANLKLTGGTLSASASPFVIASLPPGTVPAADDVVPLSQNGEVTAVTYAQFVNGLASARNVDVSQLLITPSGGTTPATLGNFAANMLPLTGGTLIGALTLAADPSAAQQAATKAYVDDHVAGALPQSGGTLTGALTLAADPIAPLQAATKHYVDAAALPIAGGTLIGPLTLSGGPTGALHAANKQYVDGQLASALPLSGGTLAGTLTLATDPTDQMHAATKRYVDANNGNPTGVINIKSPPYNAQLNGVTDDTAAFVAAYRAAPEGSVIYVPNGVTILQNPFTWGVPLTKRVKWAVDGTTLLDGTCLANGIPGGNGPASNFLPGVVVGNSAMSAEFTQTGSQPNDYAVLHSSYIVNHTGGIADREVIANSRTDTIIYNSPNSFVWGGIDRLLWCGTQTPAGCGPTEHVGRYVQTIRQTIGTDASGKPLPQPQLWAACLEYRDVTGQPSSWAASSQTVEIDWYGNGVDDAKSRQLVSLVVAQHSASGAPIEVSSMLGAYLGAGSAGHVYRVFNISVPFSTAVLDTTTSLQMTGAAAIRLAAGHAVAFEPTNSYRLAFDSGTKTLRWYQGSLSYPVGKGISVGWSTVCAATAVLANSLAGNIVFLVGSGAPYAVTLPAANTVAAGTGFTFSATGTANVTIMTAGADTIDNGPITLRQNDRYQIVSDGNGTWREVFRTNAVSPRFAAPPTLPNYLVDLLPGSAGTGALAFASNGRKPGEAAGAGSGVQVFFDGVHWICCWSGIQVAA